MNKTISSVMDISEPWDNPHGGQVWFVTAFFTDGEVLSAGRKDLDAAIELRGLLIEAIGVEQDFTLAPDKPTKSGKTKWKLLGFGTPGGAATYTAPGVQGGGGSGDLPRATGTTSHARSPELFNDQGFRTPADFRAEKALELAVHIAATDFGNVNITGLADQFVAWLRQASRSASSEYDSGGLGTVTPTPSAETPAGAGPETTSPATGSPGDAPPTAQPVSQGAETPAGDDRGGQSEGEAGCPPHDLDLDVAPKAMRYPCRKCNAWIKPTMAADEVEEMTT